MTPVFAYFPMYGIQLAFREFDFSAGLTGGEWVGMKYFSQFFASPLFWDLIRNTVAISLTTLVVGFIAPIVLALAVNQVVGVRRKRFTQTATYLPHFISIVVVVGMLQVFLSPTSGVIPNFLGALRGDRGQLPGRPGRVRPGVRDLRGLAALRVEQHHLPRRARRASTPTCTRRPGSTARAARRSSGTSTCRRSIPTMVVLFILNMGGVLNAGFEKIFLMQNPLNLAASEVISTYVYKIGILQSQFSYSTAIGLFNTVINFAFLVLANQLAKKFANTSLW